MLIQVYKNQSVILPFAIGILSSDVDILIFRGSDGQMWDFNSSQFSASPVDPTGDMTDQSKPGLTPPLYIWSYTWTIPNSFDTYYIWFLDVDKSRMYPTYVLRVEEGAVAFTVQAGTLQADQFTTNLGSVYGDDALNNQWIQFDDDTLTVALRGLGFRVQDFQTSGGLIVLDTNYPLPVAPQAGDKGRKIP